MTPDVARCARRAILRVLFVVGAMTDLEYSLRARAKATDMSGACYTVMKLRVVDAFKRAHGIIRIVGTVIGVMRRVG